MEKEKEMLPEDREIQEIEMMIILKKLELLSLRRHRFLSLGGGVLEVSALALLMLADYDPVLTAGTVCQGLSIASVCTHHALKKQKKRIILSSRELSKNQKIHIHYINATAFLAPICTVYALQNGASLPLSVLILVSSKLLCQLSDNFSVWNREVKTTKADIQSLEELRNSELEEWSKQKEYGKQKNENCKKL